MVNILPRFAFALLALLAAVPLSPAHADGSAYGPPPAERSTQGPARTDSWVEEWDPSTWRWVRQGEHLPGIPEGSAAASARAYSAPLGAFGPFVVFDANTAAVMGPTDADSPNDFKRMRAAFPGISTLEFIDAPGTVQDIANLEVGRMIRAAGISTHVPSNGSVRSGAVELFLAGKTRTMELGARFAVHSWRDQRGRGPQDFAPDDPVNRLYTAFYEDMGMSPADAKAFYDMTNSVPNASALWFGPDVMNKWIARSDVRVHELAPMIVLAIDPNLMSQPFAPLDDLLSMPTIRFANRLPAPTATPEAILAFAGI
jgi:hypothetical protein